MAKVDYVKVDVTTFHDKVYSDTEEFIVKPYGGMNEDALKDVLDQVEAHLREKTGLEKAEDAPADE